MQKMSIPQYKALLAKSRGSKPNKYHALSSGGYASRRECRRAFELRALEKAGEIADLREQVEFVLIPAQRDPSGKLVERKCSYVADFVYFDRATSGIVVEDTKGVRTEVYKIKRKLMLFVHGISIKEV